MCINDCSYKLSIQEGNPAQDLEIPKLHNKCEKGGFKLGKMKTSIPFMYNNGLEN